MMLPCYVTRASAIREIGNPADMVSAIPICVFRNFHARNRAGAVTAGENEVTKTARFLFNGHARVQPQKVKAM